MEEVWLKTEPIDEFEACFSMKSEDGINVNVNIGLSTITSTIKKEESEVGSKNTLEEIECNQSAEHVALASKLSRNAKGKFTAKGSVKKVEKKLVEEISQSKQSQEKSTTKTSSEQDKKKRTQVAHTGKSRIFCEECGKSFTTSSGLKRHKLLHSGFERQITKPKHYLQFLSFQ